mgnify:CR=1 FL=1
MSAGELAELAEVIEAEGVPAIFVDNSASDELARTLADEVGDQVDEALASLRDYQHNLELDPAGLQQVEQRLEAIHDLARKYRESPELLPARLLLIEQELDHCLLTDEEMALDWSTLRDTLPGNEVVTFS